MGYVPGRAAAAASAMVLVMTHPQNYVQNTDRADGLWNTRSASSPDQAVLKLSVVVATPRVQPRPEGPRCPTYAADHLVVHREQARPLACKHLPRDDPADTVLLVQQIPGKAGRRVRPDVLGGAFVAEVEMVSNRMQQIRKPRAQRPLKRSTSTRAGTRTLSISSDQISCSDDIAARGHVITTKVLEPGARVRVPDSRA
jgi:hypothetical protein